ncbi:AAA family ATPase [Natrinema sp. H-ect1]|uniref:DUF7125 family protein n=1 Tax=Natrinema sp. H-ect1 TaxID=3242700 RepID=UPI00359CDBBB
MIAIAGAKGGCGKTVTTIGLAEAVTRETTTAIAVDADRQLPNLHVAGGVDREPTLAALESESAVAETVVQSSPRTDDAGLVAAPEPSDRVDFEAAFDRLERAAERAFVDCPSGAGPDVVEALSAADGVIVVTTETERSLTAAETTIEMARRLEVPILGAVVNRCDRVPEAVDSWTRVPVLGRVPEGEAPLTDEATREAYEGIARTIERRLAPDRTPVAYDEELLPTGIDALDRALGGGLEPGSLVAVVAEPASQSEQLLYGTTAVRGTLYLSTERSTANVSRALEAAAIETGNPTVRRLGGETGLDDAAELLETLPASSTLIVDPTNAMETTDRATYVSFLDALTERLVATESIGLLHCLEGPAVPANRTATLHAADAVFELESEPAADGTDHTLSISKFRGDNAGTERIRLAFDGRSPASIEATDSRS